MSCHFLGTQKDLQLYNMHQLYQASSTSRTNSGPNVPLGRVNISLTSVVFHILLLLCLAPGQWLLLDVPPKMCVHVHICIHVCVSTCTFVHVCVSICTCMCTCTLMWGVGCVCACVCRVPVHPCCDWPSAANYCC